MGREEKESGPPGCAEGKGLAKVTKKEPGVRCEGKSERNQERRGFEEEA